MSLLFSGGDINITTDVLMLLFQGDLFFISLLTLIVNIIAKIIKNSSPHRNLDATNFYYI